jgi:hypothetical protein
MGFRGNKMMHHCSEVLVSYEENQEMFQASTNRKLISLTVTALNMRVGDEIVASGGLL